MRRNYLENLNMEPKGGEISRRRKNSQDSTAKTVLKRQSKGFC